MNCFRFMDNYYLQLKGTAKGIRIAPSYENLSIGKFKDDLYFYFNPSKMKTIFGLDL